MLDPPRVYCNIVKMTGSKEDLDQMQNLYEISVGVQLVLSPTSAAARRSQAQAQETLKNKADQGNAMAQLYNIYLMSGPEE